MNKVLIKRDRWEGLRRVLTPWIGVVILEKDGNYSVQSNIRLDSIQVKQYSVALLISLHTIDKHNW